MSGNTPTATKPPRRDNPSGLAGGSGARRGDAVFGGVVRGAAAFLLILMAAIALFLVVRAWGALTANHANVLTYQGWDPDGGSTGPGGAPGPAKFGIGVLAWGTLITSLFAILFAAPVAIGVSLFITQYAPRRLAQALGYLVDLLAAVPSVVYGLWGLLFLVPHMTGPSKFVNSILGWIPIFDSNGTFGRSVFTAGVVLAIMILPIIAAISREVFLQTPSENIEAAYALGATRWEMIRYAVLPYGRSGVSSAIVLGFGRALGETIAVAMVLSTTYNFTTKFLEPGGNTIAANIANQFGSAFKTGQGALIASGLVLFVVTFAVNYLARRITARGVREHDRRNWGLGSVLTLFTVRNTGPSALSGEQDGRPAHRAADARGPLAGVSTIRRVKNTAAGMMTSGAFLLALLPLASILILVIGHGAGRLDQTFLNNSMRNIAEQEPGGGAYHAILGTLEQAGLATVMAVPLGILVAIYLVEYGRGRLARAVTFFVDVMMGLPSIVAGLFIFSLWLLGLGFHASGFAGSLALMILMMPLVIRSSEEMLKLVPDSLREAAYALGIAKWRTVVRVVLPTALPGIVTGVMLGVARVMGETAPILLVVGVTQSINPNPFNGAQGSLPVFIFGEANQPYQTAVDRAWAGALILILLIMLLNLTARLIAWWKKPGRA
jgi:phosphate ABC transporter permease protein PstC/phosphate ABC transporter permease subunit PstA